MKPIPRHLLAIAWVIALVGCASVSSPQGTAGGFGEGDPASIPTFRRIVSAGHSVLKEPLPKVGGGNAQLIRALLSPAAISAGEREPDTDAGKMRQTLSQALGSPSTKPSRLFFVSRAFAFEDARDSVVLLICDDCGTAALAMQPAGKDSEVVLSPQFDLSVLGSLFAP